MLRCMQVKVLLMQVNTCYINQTDAVYLHYARDLRRMQEVLISACYLSSVTLHGITRACAACRAPSMCRHGQRSDHATV